MMEFIFPEKALAVLREARWDANATRGYELLSGAVTWSDERVHDFVLACMEAGCHEYGTALAYRTSLIEGRPREELRFAWDELRLRCPEWIGFQIERVSSSPEVLEFLCQSREQPW